VVKGGGGLRARHPLAIMPATTGLSLRCALDAPNLLSDTQ
jgi:hypothetical protein